MKNQPITCERFFPLSERSRHSAECLLNVFAQVFVTVCLVNEACYEMWCPVVFMKTQVYVL